MWRKKALEAVNGWNENQTSSQEYELLFRLLKNNIVVRYCPLSETIVYLRNNSIVRSENNERFGEILNNYVDLRLAMRDYLESRGLLTPELRNTVNTRIYFKLKTHQKRLPLYVTEKLKETKLKIPLKYLLSDKMSKFKSKTKRIIKKLLP